MIYKYRWFKENKIEQVGLGEEYIYRTHLIGITVLFEPELSDARLVYAKYCILLALNDDFFEHLASKDELLNIIQLVERWDEYKDVGFYSERVKLYFTALYNTVEEVAANAQIKQGQSVKHHLVALFLEGMKSTLVDRVEWVTKDTTPSIEEYLRVAISTFGLKCILLTTQYVVGIKLSQHQFESAEMDNLLNYAGIAVRLLNDLQSFKREGSESRIVNIVTLLVKHSSGRICEEEAIRQVEETIESNRRKLLRMVVVESGKGSQLPQAFKDLFWRTAKTVYFLYSDHDEFRSPKKVKHHINELIYKPLNPSLTTISTHTLNQTLNSISM